MHNVLAITDRAVAAYLKAETGFSRVYPFKNSAGKELPCVIVHASPATPIAPFSGNYDVEVAITIRTLANVEAGQQESDPLSDSDVLLDEIMSALHRFGDGEQSGGTLADSITVEARLIGLTKFTCQGYGITSLQSSIEDSGDSNVWTDTINLTLNVCPSDVS